MEKLPATTGWLWIKQGFGLFRKQAAALSALFIEKDDAKRMAGYKAVNKTIADNAYVLPLFQFYQPVVWKSALSFKPHLAGFILPQAVGRAGK